MGVCVAIWRRSVACVACLVLAALVGLAACTNEQGLDPGEQGAPQDDPSEPSDRPSTSTEPRDSDSSSTTAPTTTSSAEPSTSTPSTEEGMSPLEEEIVSRYLGFWRARATANSGTPNPADPALADFATGEQLAAVIAETQVNLERGVSYREADDPVGFQRVQVLSVEGDHAVVQECFVDDGLVVSTESGQVVDADVTTQNARGELVREGGQWRVSRVQVIQMWEGVAGCANAS